MDERRDGQQFPLFKLPAAAQLAKVCTPKQARYAGSAGRPPGMKPARRRGRVARGGKAERGPMDGGRAYLFRVVLKWDRQVWRTIEVRGDQTLDDLHLAIQEAFGWDNDHLYAFFMSGKRWDQATEYADPRAEDGRSADEVRIDALKLVPRKRFLYLFDYGDELLHDVWLVRVGHVDAAVKYPRIVQVQGGAPPQYPSDGEDE